MQNYILCSFVQCELEMVQNPLDRPLMSAAVLPWRICRIWETVVALLVLWKFIEVLKFILGIIYVLRMFRFLASAYIFHNNVKLCFHSICVTCLVKFILGKISTVCSFVFICVYFVCFCFILHMCVIIVRTVGWTWWDWSLIIRTYLPSMLWHCWVDYLTCTNPSQIWPIMCLVGH